MKKLLMFLLASLLSLTMFAQPKTTHVKSYHKKDGTSVRSHKKTKSNKTQKDNWSAKGNTNPNTGKKGYKESKK